MSSACSWYINGKNGDSFSTKSVQELLSPVSERQIGKLVIESKVLVEDILNDGHSHAYAEATRSPLKSDISFPPQPPFKSDPNEKLFGITFKSWEHWGEADFKKDFQKLVATTGDLRGDIAELKGLAKQNREKNREDMVGAA